MQKTIYILLGMVFLLLPQSVPAQKQSNIWCFGTNVGLDFNSGNPILFRAALDQHEGSASVADRTTGQLLFYTDGMNVWNRNHTVMPNGLGLLGNRSSTQSALIIPKPRSTTEYYIFSSDAGPYSGDNNVGIHYSIVDISQDGGLGAVTIRNQLVMEPASERMLAIEHCNGQDFWVITHAWGSDEYRVFPVTRYGIGTPVTSKIGVVHNGIDKNFIGYTTASSDSRRIASVIWGMANLEVFDFDNSTGQLSNLVTVQVDSLPYGVCFSPDGSKIYVTAQAPGRIHGDANGLYQFDLTNYQPTAIAASRVLLQSDPNYKVAALQLAPNGKIYMARIGDSLLGVINTPNAKGTACNYQFDGLSLAPYKSMQGLPNVVTTFLSPLGEDCRPPLAAFQRSDTLICEGECIRFTDQTIDNPTSWQWSFQGGRLASYVGKSPPEICYDTPGTYRVTLVTTNAHGSDTVFRTVRVVDMPGAFAGYDADICIGESRNLAATGNGEPLWSPNTGLSCTACPNPVARPTKTTMYRLMMTNQYGCVSFDSVVIRVHPLPIANAGKDVTICSAESTTLSATGDGTYLWSPSTGLSCSNCPNPVAQPTKTTAYRLTVTNQFGCSDVDSVVVRVVASPTAEAGPDKYICSGDIARLAGTTVSGATYQWSPTTRLNCSTCPTTDASPEKTTTYHLTVTNNNGCTMVDSVTVYVDPAPRTVSAHINQNYTVFPGTQVKIPITLDDPLDSAYINDLTLTIRYQSDMMTLISSSQPMLSLLVDGTLLDGWTPMLIDSRDGIFTVRIVAPIGRCLNGTGTLVQLRFIAYLSNVSYSELPFEIELNNATCTTIKRTPGFVRLDSVCSLNLRLIESFATGFSLGQNTPNPFKRTTTIPFSLGLDGYVTLDVFNQTGQKVATLIHETLDAGSHQVIWNAATFAPGVYYYRLVTDSWSDEKTMILQQ